MECCSDSTFPSKPTLTKSIVPYTDRDSEMRGPAEVWWWDAYTKLSGGERYRYLVVVDRIVTPAADGSQIRVRPDYVETFVYFGLKESDCCQKVDPQTGLEIPAYLGNPLRSPEVRSAITARTPFAASAYSVVPTLLTKQNLDQWSVWFKATANCGDAPAGFTTEALRIDPERPWRAVASEDVHLGKITYE